MKPQLESKKVNVSYTNGGKLSVIYHAIPTPDYVDADRIEVLLVTDKSQTINFRMTFAEALTMIRSLTKIMDVMLEDHYANPNLPLHWKA